MQPQLSVHTQQDATVVSVAGDLDIHNAPGLGEQLDEVVRARPALVVVDLAGVGFLDSSTLGVLIGVYKQLQEAGGRLCLAGVQPHILKVLQITRLDEIIPVFDTVAAAAGS